jgi:hypothetical protein
VDDASTSFRGGAGGRARFGALYQVLPFVILPFVEAVVVRNQELLLWGRRKKGDRSVGR